MKVIKAKRSLATLHNARNLKVYIKREENKTKQDKPIISRDSKWLKFRL